MRDSVPGGCWDCWLPALEPLEVSVLGPANIGAAAGFVEGAGPGRDAFFCAKRRDATTGVLFCYHHRIFLLELAIVFSGDLQLAILFWYIPYRFLLQPVTVFAGTRRQIFWDAIGGAPVQRGDRRCDATTGDFLC